MITGKECAMLALATMFAGFILGLLISWDFRRTTK